MSLLNEVKKIAEQNPEMRKYLVPLIRKASLSRRSAAPLKRPLTPVMQKYPPEKIRRLEQKMPLFRLLDYMVMSLLHAEGTWVIPSPYNSPGFGVTEKEAKMLEAKGYAFLTPSRMGGDAVTLTPRGQQAWDRAEQIIYNMV